MIIINKNGCITSLEHHLPKTITNEKNDEYELQRKCGNEKCVNERHYSYKLVKDQGMPILEDEEVEGDEEYDVKDY